MVASPVQTYDVIVLGAGAAGLMCGIEAARRGRRVAVIDHASAPAEKIRISGGGKCNFTHLKTTPKNYLSANPHFCISALKRYTPWDFLDRVVKRRIPYYEKSEGQLFCETSARDIIDMLLDDLRDAGGALWLETEIQAVERGDGFALATSGGELVCESLVVATGGLSIPKMGATGFAYELARQFGHTVLDTRAALVPFTLGPDWLEKLTGLAGVAFEATVTAGKMRFTDGFLFTHRGLSGPAVLQASSYWAPGEAIMVDLLPGQDAAAWLVERKRLRGRQTLAVALSELFPRRFVDRWVEINGLRPESHMADLPNASLNQLGAAINRWTLTPMGTEGYRTAEVTAGGIDTKQLSSQTMESQLCPGLYFIGECVDVTGWLGGYNFQWAWSSGWAAGQVA